MLYTRARDFLTLPLPPPGIEQARREADHSSRCISEGKNMWLFTSSAHLYSWHSAWVNTGTNLFTWDTHTLLWFRNSHPTKTGSLGHQFFFFGCDFVRNYKNESIVSSLLALLKIIIILAVQPIVGPLLLFQFPTLYTDGRTPVARPLPTHRATQTQNKRTQTSILRVEFNPTIPALERAKTVHALDRAATVMGQY
jgi:hypothetical protein